MVEISLNKSKASSKTASSAQNKDGQILFPAAASHFQENLLSVLIGTNNKLAEIIAGSDKHSLGTNDKSNIFGNFKILPHTHLHLSSHI